MKFSNKLRAFFSGLFVILCVGHFWIFSSPSQNQTVASSEKNPMAPQQKISEKVSIGSISGTATISRSGKTILLTRKEPLQVFESDRIIISGKESCVLNYPDGRRVKFAGEGEYVPTNGEIKITRGGMALSFSSSPKGYKIALPTATLGIRGTVIHIKIDSFGDDVWVHEGKIDWENLKTGEKGNLDGGKGLRFEGGRQEVIAKSPLESQAPSSTKPNVPDAGTENQPPTEISTDSSELNPIEVQPIEVKDPFSDGPVGVKNR